MNFSITIIIPCYNMGSLLLETIDSVRKVINPDQHEVLIVNDGSTDEVTIAILNRIKEAFTVIDQDNQGLSAARNTGIRVAKGKYLLFLDADNLLTDVYLKQGVDIMEQLPEIDIVYGMSETFGAGDSSFLPSRPYNLQLLMMYNYIDACCLVRKSAFDDVGMFDIQMRSGLEDWEMWLRMAFNQKKFYYLDGLIVQKYRVRPDSMVRAIDKIKRDTVLAYLMHKYPENLNYDAVSDFYYTKFAQSPLGWVAKLFIRKYNNKLYNYLVRKGKIRKYL